MIRKFFEKISGKNPAHTLYTKLVGASRHADFYGRYGVADTLDGRFDMLLLHLFLVSERLQGATRDLGALPRDLVEMMIADMDRTLREIGVGDMAVGKQVKAMAQAWFGREDRYRKALQATAPDESLTEALRLNVFREKAGEAEALARYVRVAVATLNEYDDSDMAVGRFSFPDPVSLLEDQPTG